MKIDFWTLLLQAVNALILIWLLSRVLYRPVAQMIAQRRDAAGRMLAEAESARADARKEAQAAADEKAALLAGHEAALKAAEADAGQARVRLLAAARSEADAMHRQAEADAQKRCAEEAKANEQRAAALAVDIAGRLLDRLPPAVRVMGFLDGLVDALRALPAIQRKALADPAAGLRLAAARALSADELSGCTQAIQAALGCRSAISPEVEPGLIAGLELRSNDLLVGNHLRADLDQLRRELSDADGTA